MPANGRRDLIRRLKVNGEAVHSRITFVKALSFCFTAFITISNNSCYLSDGARDSSPHIRGGVSPTAKEGGGARSCGFGGSARIERKPNVTGTRSAFDGITD